MYRGWYCSRKVCMNLRSFSTSFTFPRNFYDSFESLSLSSILAFRFTALSYNLMIFSLCVLPSSSNFLISLALCLLSSYNSRSRLSKAIIRPSILLMAALVKFLNWLTYSVWASWRLTISSTYRSRPYLYCRDYSPLAIIYLSRRV
jgi:hypothetical protein